MANIGSALQIYNSILSDNVAQEAPDLASLPPNNSVVRFTLVEDPDGHTLDNGVAGNIVGFSADLGPLRNNGGNTLTQLPGPSSPVIGQADPVATLATDQRGFFRPGNDGLRDMGAVETDATKPGDFNGDGEFDCSDIDGLTHAVAMGDSNPVFDLNQDGLVNVVDVSTWLQLAGEQNLGPGRSYLPGDANLDGGVDGRDFGIWNSSRFTFHAGWCGGDFNADGFVDGSDFNIWNMYKFNQSEATPTWWPGNFRQRRETPVDVWDAALVALRIPPASVAPPSHVKLSGRW